MDEKLVRVLESSVICSNREKRPVVLKRDCRDWVKKDRLDGTTLLARREDSSIFREIHKFSRDLKFERTQSPNLTCRPLPARCRSVLGSGCLVSRFEFSPLHVTHQNDRSSSFRLTPVCRHLDELFLPTLLEVCQRVDGLSA